MSKKPDPVVTLADPIKVGDEKISTVTLRKPQTGDLRGLKLANILQLDVNAMVTLLPRITSPALSPDQVAGLDPADFTDLASQVVVFFARPEQLQDLKTLQ
ncbi:MAG: phage tail assembly protein [Pseudopelagicola sp.]|nr:phage tail assembly protein [Pseudopelagicola sp.]